MRRKTDALRRLLADLPQGHKVLVGALVDILICGVSLWLAFLIRVGLEHPEFQFPATHLRTFLFALAVAVPCFYFFGLYRESLRYSGPDLSVKVSRACVVAVGIWLLLLFFGRVDDFMPRSVPVLYLFLLTGGMLGSRAWGRRWLLRTSVADLRARSTRIPVAIYGGGSAGMQLMRALELSEEYNPVAVVDTDPKMHKRFMSGRPVYGPDDIERMIDLEGVKEILLAMPSLSRRERRMIVESLDKYQIALRTIPSLEDLATGRARVEDLRPVAIGDVLGRAEVVPLSGLLERCIRGKSVMVTGAGGSIGAELSRQIAALRPRLLVLFDHAEYNLYSVERSVGDQVGQDGQPVELIAVLGSVLDGCRLLDVMRYYSIQTVYHAAAYKHVPVVEQNISQGLRNNVLGTLYAAEAAVVAGVERFVLISTDKAVRPTSVMGASKRLAEMLLQAMSAEQSLLLMDCEALGLDPDSGAWRNQTCFTMVRFGNVLDSSGSVIPVFRNQIRAGGPVTVTHPEIVRYFMTIAEAAQLVLQAGSMAEGGDVFLLDMGEPVCIADLARRMISLSGLTARDESHPEGDIEIVFTGLRPGEKLYEEMLIDDTAVGTDHPRIFRGQEPFLPWQEITQRISKILDAVHVHDYLRARELLQQTVSGYEPSGLPLDLLHASAEPAASESVDG